MRGKASKLVACAALALAATCACALPAKPAHKRAVALRTPARVAAGKHSAKAVVVAHVQSKRNPARTRSAAPPAEPETETPILVNHNRKRHYSADPAASPVRYTRHARLTMPAALKGSHAILLRQNEIANSEGLDRVQDDGDLDDMRGSKLLVALPAVAGLRSDERLHSNRRFCRPWTAQFLAALAHAHYVKFRTALQVNSAVRTVEFQRSLLLTNGNAAPAEGETASPHLTGQAVDLGKKGLSLAEIAWLRGYLVPLMEAGKVDVEEEFQQACFHISVYRKYVPEPEPRREIAQAHRVDAVALATAIR